MLKTNSGGSKIKIWNSSTKGGSSISLPATYATPTDLPKSLYVEGFSSSSSVRDIELALEFSVGGKTFDDRVKITVLKPEITELGFKNDHMITKWPSGTKIDDPDGSTPVWKKTNNPNDPVCYTKNTSPTMFAVFNVTPNISPDITGVQVRAKVGTVVIGSASGGRISGTVIEDGSNTDGDVDDIGGGSAVPNSNAVKTLTPTFTWEVTFDGTSWCSANNIGPHTMYWTNATPLENTLYDLALDKACGYVNGDSDIPGKINSGMDSDITYDPAADHEHDLDIFSVGEGECCCHAIVFRQLVRSVGVDGTITYIWGGCSSSYVDYYKYGTWWVSFRVIKSAHDNAEANPHFTYHVETLVSGTYYDPSYGATGLISLDETAPTHNPYPAASRQTGSSLPGNVHYVDWTCPH